METNGAMSDAAAAMPRRRLNVLFVCTGNSARSIMAEAILRKDGATLFDAFSAGSQPTGHVHRLAIETLQKHGFPIAHLRSKSWGEFETPEAPPMDFVVTVCDHAAARACPVWPGQPIIAHWSVPDPASVEGGEHDKRAAFGAAFALLATRIARLRDIAVRAGDRASLEAALRDLARVP